MRYLRNPDFHVDCQKPPGRLRSDHVKCGVLGAETLDADC